VPVGTVNPGGGYTAGQLSGAPGAGVGKHWWRTLHGPDFVGHQLPDPAGGHKRPVGWYGNCRVGQHVLLWRNTRPAPRGPGLFVRDIRQKDLFAQRLFRYGRQAESAATPVTCYGSCRFFAFLTGRWLGLRRIWLAEPTPGM